jgi:hypothetical protein
LCREAHQRRHKVVKIRQTRINASIGSVLNVFECRSCQ